MGNITKSYESIIINMAKKSYLDSFMLMFPDFKDYTDFNIRVTHKPGYNNFNLHMVDSYGSVIHEKSFCFSDF